MNSTSLLDLLMAWLPFRRMARGALLFAGVALAGWGAYGFLDNGYWLDLLIYAAVGMSAFYGGITLKARPGELSLGDLFAATDTTTDAVSIPEQVATVGAEDVPAASAAHASGWIRLWPLVALPMTAWVAALWRRQLMAGEAVPSLASMALMAAGVLAFWPVIRAFTAPVEHAESPAVPAARTGFRPNALLIALGAMLLAFIASSGNRFNPVGVAAWVVGVGASVFACAERLPSFELGAWRQRLRDGLNLRVTRATLLLCAVLLVGAYFRFAGLDAIPPEMTSDHVEKLLDVNDVLNGARSIFFERNTGRETLQFYFAAWVAGALGTGLTHLTLKITSALAGLLTLPFIYLLGKELEDETLGLLGAMLAAFAIWPVAISRVGLRFPFSPVFVAPALVFLFRGLRAGRRNDFIWAGLALGAGLYGYSPFRDMAVVVALFAAAYLARNISRDERLALLANLGAMSLTTLAVFVPLLRYASQNPDMFWYRSMGRLANDGLTLGEAWRVFWSNQWNALQMFFWRGDLVWVNALPGRPVLDPILAGLFLLGVVTLAVRAVRRRSLRDALTLALVPVLMLPSTLALAFPMENPSVVRAGGALVIVFLIAAQPLRLAIQYARESLGDWRGAWAGGLIVTALLGAALAANHRLYFVEYPAQYVGAAQNASEIGAVVRGFAESIGSWDTAVVRAYPHWVDTRAVGIYAGRIGWDNVYLDNSRFGELAADPRPKLYILHRDDREAIAELRALYPQGTLSRYTSARPHHDFLMFLVPGTHDLDESTLPPIGSP